MSIYGNFACFDCRVGFFIGAAVFEADKEHISFFHHVYANPPNWDQPILNKVMWKFLADHAGHKLHVVVEGEPLYREIDDFMWIGGDEIGFPSFEEYLKDWRGG